MAATVTPLMVTLVGALISRTGQVGLEGGPRGGGAGGRAVCGRGVMVASLGAAFMMLELA